MKNLKILDTMNTGGVLTQFMPAPCVPPQFHICATPMARGDVFLKFCDNYL